MTDRSEQFRIAEIIREKLTLALRQRVIPNELLGRVGASYRFLVFLGMPIGAIVQGALTDIVGPRVVVFAMGSVLVAGTLLLKVSGRSTTLDAA